MGIIVPTGIATDDTCKMFFGDLVKQQHLASLYDFENRDKLFAAVDSRMKFCLLGISKRRTEESRFGFFLTRTKQLEEKNRVFNLKAEEIALINPNTLTCPVFRTSEDAQLTKKIYHQLQVIENEKKDSTKKPVKVKIEDMDNSVKEQTSETKKLLKKNQRK